jgi:rfaE bifunctional protein nucleotidyltransferase chain/domain/rfaE bifunctional protein kinase chain/domain
MVTAVPRVTVVGDVLLDRDWTAVANRLAPDGPVPVLDEPTEVARPGGAGLAAVAARRLAAVTLVTSVGDDDAGGELRRLLRQAGVDLVDVGHDGPTPEKIRVRANGQTVARVDRGCRPGRVGPLGDDAVAALTEADAVLVADYGRGFVTAPGVADVLRLAARHVPVAWDPHRSGPAPLPGTDVATPNLEEARSLLAAARHLPAAWPELCEHALAARDRWGCPVAVTGGSLGAALAEDDGPVQLAPATPVTGDANGAGDHLVATYVVGRARGLERIEALRRGVDTATAYVAGRLDGPSSAVESAAECAARVRAAGGVVVAAGGCFDLLHPGHVHLLQQARAAGDGLIVCVNSDRSVRRMKGPGRPVHAAADRAELLLALGCVDAVEIFEEDTPVDVLSRLRPDLFVKGADYRGADLPEAHVMARWGGRVVLVPLLGEHSTTGSIARALRAAG